MTVSVSNVEAPIGCVKLASYNDDGDVPTRRRRGIGGGGVCTGAGSSVQVHRIRRAPEYIPLAGRLAYQFLARASYFYMHTLTGTPVSGKQIDRTFALLAAEPTRIYK